MSTRTELVAAIRERYQPSVRPDRTSILDEFVAVTGYHRKHAIRLLSSGKEPHVSRVRRVSRRYGGDVREGLIALWEASDRVCSKRLKPLIPVLLPALERHQEVVIDAALLTLLMHTDHGSVVVRGAPGSPGWPAAGGFQFGSPALGAGSHFRRLE